MPRPTIPSFILVVVLWTSAASPSGFPTPLAAGATSHIAPATAAPSAPPAAPFRQLQDAFERGQALLDQARVADALNLWIGLRDSLTAVGAEDPRIGTAFVATVAEHRLDAYEEAAALMFYWGFSVAEPGTEAREEILAEGRRTFALVDSATAHAWQAAGRTHPASLARAIKQFWLERDPTPTTLANERLAEHWARVAHARANYVYNRRSAFATDDRGVMYVKYGKPAEVTAGHLKISTTEARWRGISRDDLFRWDVDPQYEIWRYGTLGERDFSYFMFGNEDGTGPFRLVVGPHEILPRSARSGPGSRLPTGIRAQYYLELFYYVELARAGGPFGDRLAQLEALWTQMGRATNDGYLEAMSLVHIEDDIERAERSRPASWSEIDEAPRSALSAQAVRVMRDGEPRILLLAVSSPRWTREVSERELPDELVLDDYTPNHTVVARDQRLNELARASLASLDRYGEFSQVQLRHDPRIGHLSLAARHDMAVADGLSTPVFPGSQHFVVDAPLSLDLAGFDVSDVLVGIAPQPALSIVDLPAPLLPATRFWRDDLLRVYFETYRPSATPSNQTKTYDVRLRIAPIIAEHFHENRSPAPPVREEVQGPASVSMALESQGPEDKHFFDLDLRNEPPGILRLVLDVADPATGITKTRAAVIQLLAN